jgi:tetratricopeptide (TPR) repeat protein
VSESVRIFLSTVSDEFRIYRDQLRGDLTRHNVEVKVQEDFKDLGGVTLEKLDDYIKLCDAVVHLVGDMTGAAAREPSTKAILVRYSDLPEKLPPLGEALEQGVRISYTQWEAWLALYHGKVLLIAQADKAAPRGPAFAATDATRAAQKEHLARLRAVERYPGSTFTSPDNLAKQIAYTTILDLLAKARAEAPLRQPRNLPFASLGTLFKGREKFLEELHDSLTKKQDGHAAAVTGKALHGLGGIGKTRLAIEYSWKYAEEYSALLFVPAETPERLEAGLAALAGVLDLPEKDAREDALKIAAAHKWLDDRTGWLMILDNVDDAQAAAAAEELVAKLKGGHVLITGRTANFSAAVETFELDVLAENDATDLLLESTTRRARALDDDALAHELAHELGGLALALAQAGAYINQQRIAFTRYLSLWREKRETVINWFDKSLVSYNHDVGLATTWVTSVEQLTPGGRNLLELLAFLAPDPVPQRLLEVAVPSPFEESSSTPLSSHPIPSRSLRETLRSLWNLGRASAQDKRTRAAPAKFDVHEALADLFSYSLATRVAVTEGQGGEHGFAVHRLVQEFTRGRLEPAKRKEVLAKVLGWVDAAFTGDPSDVRSWPALEPLASHALAVAERAHKAGISEPTARLMNMLGSLFTTKSRYAEAEPMLRRALAISEQSFGRDHPNVASDLNNLAQLLKATNRLGEAEPLIRRALAIAEASFGRDDPNVATCLNNLAQLLQATNRLGEAEPSMRRALAIAEASFGRDDPNVATCLNNLAQLLQDTNRLGEAEPLMRRALAIDEASFGPDHPNVARDLNNLALLLQATNRLGEAEPLMRRALSIDEKSFGPDHPRFGAQLNNLASLLRITSRLTEAEPLMRRALAIDEKSFGPDHPEVAIRLNNLAHLLQATNRLEEAELLMRRALAIDEKSLGPDHPDVATILATLATLLKETNRLAEAEPLMRRHVEIFLSFTARTGHEHPNLLASFGNYTALLRAMGRSKAKARAAIEALIRAHGLTQP